MHIPYSCPWRLAEDFPLKEIFGCGGPEHRCHLGKLDFYTVVPKNVKLYVPKTMLHVEHRDM